MPKTKSTTPRRVTSIRTQYAPDEIKAVRIAAARSDLTPTAFVKKAAIDAAKGGAK
jgi:uncharacterized protein (DUF1778 family)